MILLKENVRQVVDSSPRLPTKPRGAVHTIETERAEHYRQQRQWELKDQTMGPYSRKNGEEMSTSSMIVHSANE